MPVHQQTARQSHHMKMANTAIEGGKVQIFANKNCVHEESKSRLNPYSSVQDSLWAWIAQSV
jgi:hypothetical protein